MCHDESLIGYLYDELPAAERAAFEAHLDGCEACRHELGELQATRRHLTAWASPEPAFDIRLVRRGAPVPARRAWGPAWGLAAAAALLLLAGAAAIANLELRIGSDGLVVRTGWAVAGEVPAADSASLPADPAVRSAEVAGDLAREIQALETRLGDLEAAQAAVLQSAAPAATGDRAAVDALEARMRRLITDSERRQRTEMAVHITQMWRDLNAVRANDFARVQQSLDQVQGQTNYQLRQHRDQVQSQLLRVSLQK